MASPNPVHNELNTIQRERRRYPWERVDIDKLEACLACTNLRDPDQGFSELQFIDGLDKQRRKGIFPTYKQLRALRKIYQRRVIDGEQAS